MNRVSCNFLCSLVIATLVAVSARADEPTDKLPQAAEGKSWKLVWQDEFDGAKLDESKWIYRQEGRWRRSNREDRP